MNAADDPVTAGRRIYLDHNATAPPAAGLLAELASAWSEGWGNPSSGHAEGRRARVLLERARASIAAALGAEPAEVVLTSGGSEADALALRGLADAGRIGTIVAWALEHPAILETARWLAARGQVGLRIVEASPEGTCPVDGVAAALSGADRPLVSVMLAQNEIGTVNDLPALAAVAHAAGALVLTDAVQAFGKIPLDTATASADLVAVSAHKIGGLAGAGALVLRGGLAPVPFCGGGGQESGRRQGTEGAAAAIAFGLAADRVPGRLAAEDAVRALRDGMEEAVLAALPGTLVAGRAAPRLPNTVAFVFEGVAGADVVAACDAEGVALSAGSACHSGAHGGSPVARALGLPASHRAGLVRVSLGPDTPKAEIEHATRVLIRAVRGLRARDGD